MVTTSFAFCTEGNSNLYRAVADALDSTVGGYYRGLRWEEDHAFPNKIPALAQDQSVRNVGILEIAGVFSVFVASCFGKKIFDELYERTAKRPIGEFLDKVLSKAEIPKSKAIEFRDVIYLEDIDTVIVIRSLIDPARTGELQQLLLQGHRVANAYLESNGRVAPVHCHTIEDGMIELEPKLYTSLAHLNRQTRKSLVSPSP
jgi:hypothetical protein